MARRRRTGPVRQARVGPRRQQKSHVMDVRPATRVRSGSAVASCLSARRRSCRRRGEGETSSSLAFPVYPACDHDSRGVSVPVVIAAGIKSLCGQFSRLLAGEATLPVSGASGALLCIRAISGHAPAEHPHLPGPIIWGGPERAWLSGRRRVACDVRKGLGSRV